ncbi:hypothetical protein RI367_002550 [Sorochytrium milnesiophthora]
MSFMSSVTRHLARGARRRPLTPKNGNKNYYKGTGTGAHGRHIAQGTYIILPQKVREWVVPDLRNFSLKPYVSWSVPVMRNSVTTESFLASHREPAGDAAATTEAKGEA